MPAIVAKAPNPISFSRNSISLQIKSADFQTSAPVKAVNRLEFTAAVTEGTEIVLNWTGSSALFTASNAPDDSGTQFPTGDGSAGYVQELVAWFQSNYFIDHDFNVIYDESGAHPALEFNARSTGPQYNFTPYTSATVCSNTQAGTDGGTKENFFHHIEVWILDESGSGSEVAYAANVPLDFPITGITSLDISDALHGFLSHDEPVQSSSAALCTKSIRQFYFKYAQFYGADPVIRKVATSDRYFVAFGGLSKRAALLRDIKSELYPVVADPSQNRFMRQGSKNIVVTPDQPEWLTWLNLTGVNLNVVLEVTITNRDNSTTVFNAVTMAVSINQKVQFIAGYDQLNIAARQSADKVASFYTIRIKAGASYLTAAYNYVLDYRYWEWSRYFVYSNAYGAFQTLVTVGKGQTSFERTKDDAQRVTDQLSEAAFGSFLECNILIQDKGSVSIGYPRTDSRKTIMLRSFFASEKIYLFKEDQLVPVGIDTKALKDTPDGEAVYANGFDYYVAYQESNFTEDPALPDDDISGLAPGTIDPIPDPDDFDGIIDVLGNYNSQFYDSI